MPDDAHEGPHTFAGTRLELPPEPDAPGPSRAASSRKSNRRGRAPPADAPPADPKVPEIRIRTDEEAVVDEAIAALAGDLEIYQRNGRLVRVVRDQAAPETSQRPPGSPTIVTISLATLQERMATAARWIKFDKREKAWVPAHPPDWAVKALAARQEWPTGSIRVLTGVVEVPVLRPDGTILIEPGYDPATGLFLDPSIDCAEVLRGLDERELALKQAIAELTAQHGDAIDDERTVALRKLAARDAADLCDLLCDFPFSRKPVHEAVVLSALISPLARHAFHGCVPLHLFDAATAGSGKGLLSKVVGVLLLGRALHAMIAPRDDEEARKQMSMLVLGGDELVLFDNIGPKGLGSPALDAALTATAWSDRGLGTLGKVKGEIFITFYATGNNVQLHGDLARRVLHARIEPACERPEERDGWKHDDLPGYVAANRPRLVAAALNLLRLYFIAGRPSMGLKPLGSFEEWSSVVRNAIVFAGGADPVASQEELRRSADPRAGALAALLTAWGSREMTSAELVRVCTPDAHGVVAEQPLHDALAAFVSFMNGRPPSTIAVGKALAAARERVVGNRRLRSRTRRDDTQVWFVEQAATPDAGDAGDTGDAYAGS